MSNDKVICANLGKLLLSRSQRDQAAADRQAQLEKDAERYRFLREHGYGLPYMHEDLDIAIDVAIGVLRRGETP